MVSPSASFCLITGAAYGFGQSVATALASRLSPPSKVLLLGRTDPTATVDELRRSANIAAVEFLHADLARPNATALCGAGDAVRRLAEGTSRAYLIHNSGSTGPLGPLGEVDTSELEVAMRLNVLAFVELTQAFLRALPADCRPCVVNVTSLLAQVPVADLGSYCVTKAARDMAMAVLAKEHGDRAAFLSYAPGPMDTSMFDHIRLNAPSEATRLSFAEMRAKGLVDRDRSATVLAIYATTEGSFASGVHVDYYDKHPFGGSASSL